MPASQQPEKSKNAAVTASKDGTKIAFEKVGKGPALCLKEEGYVAHPEALERAGAALTDR